MTVFCKKLAGVTVAKQNFPLLRKVLSVKPL